MPHFPTHPTTNGMPCDVTGHNSSVTVPDVEFLLIHIAVYIAVYAAVYLFQLIYLLIRNHIFR